MFLTSNPVFIFFFFSFLNLAFLVFIFLSFGRESVSCVIMFSVDSLLPNAKWKIYYQYCEYFFIHAFIYFSFWLWRWITQVGIPRENGRKHMVIINNDILLIIVRLTLKDYQEHVFFIPSVLNCYLKKVLWICFIIWLKYDYIIEYMFTKL